MDSIKSQGVMTALKGREGLAPKKKGVDLLGMVNKLTEKRKSLGIAPARPALPDQAKVPSKTLPSQAMGKPKGRPFVR